MTEPGQAAEVPSRALFEDWLEDMHPRLARFQDFLLPDSVAGDFSRESLVSLEAHLLETFPDPDLYYEGSPDLDFIDGAVRYVGETYLRVFGGGWHFSEDPSFVFGRRPFLLLGTPDATPISPYHLMGSALYRRTGMLMAKVYDGQARAIAERQAQDPDFAVVREAVPGVYLPPADQEGRRAAGADYLTTWLEGMDPTLTQWRASIGARSDTLDGTVDSLSAFEALVLERLADVEALDSTDNEAFLSGATYYLGAVFRAGAGGEWAYLPGEPDPRRRLVGRPFLERHDSDGDLRRSVPSNLLRGLVEGRASGFLLSAYRMYAS